MNKELIFRIIFIIICLAGCLLQIYQISYAYFSFKTITSVNYVFERRISLPAVTLCFSKQYILRKDYIIDKFPNETDTNSTGSILTNYLNKLSIRQQFEGTLTFEEIIKNCSIAKTIHIDSDSDFIDCNRITPIRSFLNFQLKCFTLFSQFGNESNDRFLVERFAYDEINESPLIAISIPREIIKVGLYLHSRNVVLRSFTGDKSALIYVFNSVYHSVIKFHKAIVKLLPKPYITSCVDYQKFGYYSRIECISKCKFDYYKRVYDNLSGNFLLSERLESDGYYMKGWDPSNLNKSFEKIALKKCGKSCGLFTDCYQEFFALSFFFIFQISVTGDSIHQIILLPPISVDLVYTHSPKSYSEEYLCFVASIISLWFGFSISALPDLILNIFKCMKKLSTRSRLSNLNINILKMKITNNF